MPHAAERHILWLWAIRPAKFIIWKDFLSTFSRYFNMGKNEIGLIFIKKNTKFFKFKNNRLYPGVLAYQYLSFLPHIFWWKGFVRGRLFDHAVNQAENLLLPTYAFSFCLLLTAYSLLFLCLSFNHLCLFSNQIAR